MRRHYGFSLAEVAIALSILAVIVIAIVGWQVNEVKHAKAKELATSLLALDTAYYQINSLISHIPVPATTTTSQTTSLYSDTDFVCILKNTDLWINLVQKSGVRLNNRQFWFPTIEDAINFQLSFTRKGINPFNSPYRPASEQIFVINPITRECRFYSPISLSVYYRRYILNYSSDGLYIYCESGDKDAVNYAFLLDLDYTSCGAYGIGFFYAFYKNLPTIYYSPATFYYYIDCAYSGYYPFSGNDPFQNQQRGDSDYNLLSVLPKNVLDPRLDFRSLASQGYTFTFNVSNGKLNSITLSGIDDYTNELLASMLGSKWDKNTRTYILNNGNGYEIRTYNFSCGG